MAASKAFGPSRSKPSPVAATAEGKAFDKLRPNGLLAWAIESIATTAAVDGQRAAVAGAADPESPSNAHMRSRL